VVSHIFQACPVWIYTQSNITSIIIIMKSYRKYVTSDSDVFWLTLEQCWQYKYIIFSYLLTIPL
jgi:hypothetical protein